MFFSFDELKKIDIQSKPPQYNWNIVESRFKHHNKAVFSLRTELTGSNIKNASSNYGNIKNLGKHFNNWSLL